MMRKTIAAIGIGVFISSIATVNVNAAWKENNIGWWYTEGNSWATGWRNINNKWYFFDSNGYMKTGWVNSNYKWYYLNSSGEMLYNTVTPDGYTLNIDGSWNTNIAKQSNIVFNNSIDQANVYNNIIKMEANYPQGMSWTNDNSYTSKVLGTGMGCAGFSFALSDAAFGELPARKYNDLNNIRVGDILRINNDTHSVVVLKIDNDSITVAEGNLNSKIYWGRKISLSDIKTNTTYAITRYPESGNTNEVVDNNLNTNNNLKKVEQDYKKENYNNESIAKVQEHNNQESYINNEEQISYKKFNKLVCDNMYKLVNKHRKNNGVEKLNRDDDLDNSAYLKSKHMVDNNYFNHDYNSESWNDLVYSLSGQHIYGENIAQNYLTGTQYTEESAEDLANRLFDQWKKSAGHNANMLSNSFTDFGFGFYIKGNKVYATQHFSISKTLTNTYSKDSMKTDSNNDVNNINSNSEWKLMNKNGSNITVPDDGYEYSLEVQKTTKGSYYRLVKGKKKNVKETSKIKSDSNNSDSDNNILKVDNNNNALKNNNTLNSNRTNTKKINNTDDEIERIHGKEALKKSIYNHYKNHDKSWDFYYYGEEGDNKSELSEVMKELDFNDKEIKNSLYAYAIGSGEDKTFFGLTLYYR